MFPRLITLAPVSVVVFRSSILPASRFLMSSSFLSSHNATLLRAQIVTSPSPSWLLVLPGIVWLLTSTSDPVVSYSELGCMCVLPHTRTHLIEMPPFFPCTILYKQTLTDSPHPPSPLAAKHSGYHSLASFLPLSGPPTPFLLLHQQNLKNPQERQQTNAVLPKWDER